MREDSTSNDNLGIDDHPPLFLLCLIIVSNSFLLSEARLDIVLCIIMSRFPSIGDAEDVSINYTSKSPLIMIDKHAHACVIISNCNYRSTLSWNFLSLLEMLKARDRGQIELRITF